MIRYTITIGVNFLINWSTITIIILVFIIRDSITIGVHHFIWNTIANCFRTTVIGALITRNAFIAIIVQMLRDYLSLVIPFITIWDSITIIISFLAIWNTIIIIIFIQMIWDSISITFSVLGIWNTNIFTIFIQMIKDSISII